MRWLQISDIHFAYNNALVQEMRRKLLTWAQEHHSEVDALFITGDLRYAPYSPKEYPKDTYEFVSDLQKRLNVSPENTFVVPGNHDINRDEILQAAIPTIKGNYKSSDGSISQRTLELVRAQREPYYQLYEQICGKPAPDSMHHFRRVGDVNVICLDTAIFCCEDGEDGSLVVGTQLLNNLVEEVSRNGAHRPGIAIAHHSLNALTYDERQTVLRALHEMNVTLYLCGHGHAMEHSSYGSLNQIGQIYLFQCGTHMDWSPGVENTDMSFFHGELIGGLGNGWITPWQWDRRSSVNNWVMDRAYIEAVTDEAEHDIIPLHRTGSEKAETSNRHRTNQSNNLAADDTRSYPVVFEPNADSISPYHVDRPELVSKVGAALESGARSLCFVSGIAGTGKSEIAREYARCNPALKVCSIALPEHLEKGEDYNLDDIIDGIQVINTGLDTLERREICKAFIRDAGPDVLFIIDNFNSWRPNIVEEFLWAPHKVIVTTQLSPSILETYYDTNEIVELSVDETDESVSFARELFYAQLGPLNDGQRQDCAVGVDDLIRKLGYHPLLVSVAASQLRVSAMGNLRAAIDAVGLALNDAQFGSINQVGSSDAWDALHHQTGIIFRRRGGGRNAEQIEGDIVGIMTKLFSRSFPSALSEREQQVIHVLGLVPGIWVSASSVCALVGDHPTSLHLNEAAKAIDRLVQLNIVQRRIMPGTFQLVSVHAVVAEALRQASLCIPGEAGAKPYLERSREAFWCHIARNGLTKTNPTASVYPIYLTSAPPLERALRKLYRTLDQSTIEDDIIKHLENGSGRQDLSRRFVMPPERWFYKRLTKGASLALVKWERGLSLHLISDTSAETVLIDARNQQEADASIRYYSAGNNNSVVDVGTNDSAVNPCESSLVRHWLPISGEEREFVVSEVLGVPIRSIGPMAFHGCNSLESIDLGCVTTVFKGAFRGCDMLSRITVSSQNEKYQIINGALVDVNNHELVALPPRLKRGTYELPADVKAIADHALRGCNRITHLELRHVTDVGKEAFRNCTMLSYINAESVESLGPKAFLGCSRLSTVRFANLRDYGDFAFSGCTNLTSIILEESHDFKVIEGGLVNAAKGCLLLLPALSAHDSYIVPDCITSVAPGAFEDCRQLTSLDLNKVVIAGEKAFCRCSSLSSINLRNICKIPSASFVGCDQLQEIEISENNSAFEVVNGALIRKPSRRLVLVPPTGSESRGVLSFDDISEVEPEAFRSCQEMTSVALPQTKYIGSSAFRGCSKLEMVSIPNVKRIGRGAFWGCRSLKMIDLDTDDLHVSDGVLIDSLNGRIIVALPAAYSDSQSYTVPQGITKFDDGAFQHCQWISAIALGGVENLGRTPFVGCNRLERIVTREGNRYIVKNKALIDTYERCVVCLPAKAQVKEYVTANSVIRIDDYAFHNCQLLKKVTLPKVRHIGIMAFNGCYSVTSISAPLLRSAGKGAFSYCKSLKSAEMPYLAGVNPYVFSNCNSLTSLSLPSATFVEEGSFDGCLMLDYIELPQTSVIGNNAFIRCGQLKAVFNSQNLALIRAKAFSGCTKLNSIDLSGTESIEAEAFLGCVNLESINLTKVITVSRKAFYECSKLRGAEENGYWDLRMPKVEHLGQFSFEYCKSLELVAAPILKNVEMGCFEYCTSLQIVDMPQASIIGDYAFRGCESLADDPSMMDNPTITFPKAVEIGNAAFRECESLDEVLLPEARSVGNGAFNGCHNLRSIHAPLLERVDDYAFCNCRKLGTVSFPEVMAVGRYSFSGCSELVNVDIPATATVGLGAFNGCNLLVEDT